MNRELCDCEGTCYKNNTISYKLCGGRNLFEDGKQSGMMVMRLKVGEVLDLTIDRVERAI
jgi:hypothetical protein